MSVSVALATYNGAKYLRQQLADIESQSRLPDELVISDDASSDSTIAIAEEFALRAPFPVHVHRNNVREGYRKNFISCAMRCRSDLIAFCDQDDRWAKDKLATVMQCFADPAVLLVFHNARVMADDGSIVATLYPPALPSQHWSAANARPWDFSPGFTQVFRRDLLDFQDLWPRSEDENADGEPIPHDRWYYFLASALGKVQYLPECLANYRQHADNAYGWRGFAPSFANRLRDRMVRTGPAVARRQQAAARRAEVLDSIATRCAAAAAASVVSRAEMYRSLAERSAARIEVYNARTFSRRVSAFIQLINAGGYGRDYWKFGLPALLMDALVGVTGLRIGRHATAADGHEGRLDRSRG